MIMKYFFASGLRMCTRGFIAQSVKQCCACATCIARRWFSITSEMKKMMEAKNERVICRS